MCDSADDRRAGDDAGDPSDAFRLVGNEVRAEILRTMGDARLEQRYSPVVSFSDLRSRVDTDIRSSRFNYHLQQLVGRYLEREADGYRMRAEGRELYQTLRAGVFETREDVPAVNAGFECYYCSTGVEAALESGAVRIACPGCEYVYALAGAPPGAVRDGGIALDRIEQQYHHRHLSFARGVCVTCGNEPDTELVPVGDLPFDDPERQALYVYRSCGNCGDQRHLTLGTALLDDPELRAFCLDHGVDVLSTPLWELEFAATDRGVTVRSTNPWLVSLTVTDGDDTLELVVDGELTVRDRNRS
jgi:hypothetical protein